MIDLHMHTIHSDGTDSVIEILKKCEEKSLNVISISDHDSCLSYFDLETIDIKQYFSGQIIIGCEFSINYKGSMIEVLGYGFDYKKVNEFLKKYYSRKNVNENNKTLYQRLLNKIKELNLTFHQEDLKLTEEDFNQNLVAWDIYEELSKYPENHEKLGDHLLDNFAKFLRNGLTNANSKLFVNYLEFKPHIDEIIDLIHENGGLAFLAHPFKYKFCDPTILLKEIVQNYNIDGIECFHTVFTKAQMDYLVDFCHNNHLLISGGSDYHGENKVNHELGSGNNNLKIEAKIIKDWKCTQLYYRTK